MEKKHPASKTEPAAEEPSAPAKRSPNEEVTVPADAPMWPERSVEELDIPADAPEAPARPSEVAIDVERERAAKKSKE